jgi:hypothetical protein
MLKASILSAVLTAVIVISTSALAEPARVAPPPGTIEDPNTAIKLVADGPPRSLIRMDVPDQPKTLAAIATASSGSSR